MQNDIREKLFKKFLQVKNKYTRRNHGIVYYVIPHKGNKWNEFVQVQIIQDGSIKAVLNSTIKLDPEDLERHRLIISENCFHHKWDNEKNSFYYQRCFPIQKKCLILLDIVMNKFITVDEKPT